MPLFHLAFESNFINLNLTSEPKLRGETTSSSPKELSATLGGVASTGCSHVLVRGRMLTHCALGSYHYREREPKKVWTDLLLLPGNNGGTCSPA